MFVYNFKFNKNILFKSILVILGIICVSLAFVALFKIINASKKEGQSKYDCLPSSGIANIEPSNYTNILKIVNENLDKYIGQKISFTGYVYRVADINNDEFILARDMIIANNPKQTVVVGFLSKYKDAYKLENYTWIKITGTIEKGNYYGEVPIVYITDIEKVEKPDNAEVSVPDDYYIPTALIY